MHDGTMMHDGMWLAHWLWMLIVAVIVVVPFWRICTKAGHTGWLSLLVLVPLANIALLYFLAFADWPSQRKPDALAD